MNEQLFDMRLKNQIQDVFVSKEVDYTKENVIAAIATAASKIAFVSDAYDESMVSQQILDLYEKSNDEQTSMLIGMGPQYVKANIGYDVDYNDYGVVSSEYNTNKEKYDSIFNGLNYRETLKKENIIK